MKYEFIANVSWDADSHINGKITLENGKTAKFEVDILETDELNNNPALNTLKFLAENEPSIRHKIAASTIEHYKDTWFYEVDMTPEELAQIINLTDAVIEEDGAAELYYYPGIDLLAGHYVCVLLEANGEIDEPRIEG